MKILLNALNSKKKKNSGKLVILKNRERKCILKKLKQNLGENNNLFNMHIIRAPEREKSKTEAEKNI